MPKGVYQHKRPSLETRHKMSLASPRLAPWCKGLKLSDETRAKMSLSHKSNGSVPWCKGKKLSEETKRKMSISHSKGQHRGERARSWKGGISPLRHWIRNNARSKQWTKEVFSRDNFTCKMCGTRNEVGLGKTVYLEAHHKISFNEIMSWFLGEYNNFSPMEDTETLVRLSENFKPFWDINNGTTLCKDCHKKIHFGEVTEILNGSH